MPAIEIPPSEQGVVRVFAISRPVADMARALKHTAKEAVASDLLRHPVTASDLELFALSDLTGVGLQRYLTEGYDIDEDALRLDRSRLEGLDGYVLLLFSSVGGTDPVYITPSADLTLIGTYAESRRNHATATVAVEAAMPYTGHIPDPVAPKRNRIGSAFGGLFVLILFILIWWIV